MTNEQLDELQNIRNSVNDLYSKTRSIVVHNHQHINKIPTDTLQKKFIEIENEW